MIDRVLFFLILFQLGSIIARGALDFLDLRLQRLIQGIQLGFFGVRLLFKRFHLGLFVLQALLVVFQRGLFFVDLTDLFLQVVHLLLIILSDALDHLGLYQIVGIFFRIKHHLQAGQIAAFGDGAQPLAQLIGGGLDGRFLIRNLLLLGRNLVGFVVHLAIQLINLAGK